MSFQVQTAPQYLPTPIGVTIMGVSTLDSTLDRRQGLALISPWRPKLRHHVSAPIFGRPPPPKRRAFHLTTWMPSLRFSAKEVRHPNKQRYNRLCSPKGLGLSTAQTHPPSSVRLDVSSQCHAWLSPSRYKRGPSKRDKEISVDTNAPAGYTDRANEWIDVGRGWDWKATDPWEVYTPVERASGLTCKSDRERSSFFQSRRETPYANHRA
jgi:hypothetical protein